MAKRKVKPEDFHLEGHVIDLMWDEPFFGILLRKLSKRSSTQVPTAGVTVKDGELILLYNKEWCAQLEADEGPKVIKGLLMHELYHLILDHVVTRRRSPHTIWNYATDSAINSMIPRQWLPSLGVHPGERPINPETGEPAEGLLADIVAELPLKKSSDWYFEEFMQKLPDPEECPVHGEGAGGFSPDGDGDDGDGSGEGDDDGDGDGSGAGSGGDSGDGHEHGDGSPCTCGSGMVLDDHGGWDLTDTDRQMGQGKVRQALEEAVREADQSNSWGSVPSEMREHLRELISTQVDWKAVLKRFIGYSRAANWSNSMKRINKRYPYIHPGRKRNYTANILVMIDQSGSVGSDDIELFFGELQNLSKRTTFTVGFFDTEVDEDSLFEWRKGQRVKPRRHRCGGTDFDAPTQYVNERAGEYDGLLILSDGECCEPKPCRIRRGWVICPGRDLLFETTEMVARMQHEGKAKMS